MSDDAVTCLPHTLDGDHALLEMVLSSFFDNAYTLKPYGLVADNGHYEYTYRKVVKSYTLAIKVVSLSKPKPVYKLRYADRRFTLNTRFIDQCGLRSMFDMSEVIA